MSSHHDELSGFAPYLPTFNSTAIESFVHAVPGLSDHFLFMNDDFLFGAPTVPEDFLTTTGKTQSLWDLLRILASLPHLSKEMEVLQHRSPRALSSIRLQAVLGSHVGGQPKRTTSYAVQPLSASDRTCVWIDSTGCGCWGRCGGHSEAVKARELLRFHRFHRIDNDPEKTGPRLGIAPGNAA